MLTLTELRCDVKVAMVLELFCSFQVVMVGKLRLRDTFAPYSKPLSPVLPVVGPLSHHYHSLRLVVISISHGLAGASTGKSQVNRGESEPVVFIFLPFVPWL